MELKGWKVKHLILIMVLKITKNIYLRIFFPSPKQGHGKTAYDLHDKW